MAIKLIISLEASAAALDQADIDGDTPLLAALRQGQLQAASLLIARGADAVRPAAHGVTPLLLAATGGHAALAGRINGLGCPVVALDIPSGLCADTGRVLGCAVRANATATFIALKPGLLTLDGPDHCGTINVCDLGLATESDPAAHGRTVSPALFMSRLGPRPKNSHKGMMGSVGILGGAPGMHCR